MKINIHSSKLKDAFGKLLTVVDKKNTRPILSTCLLRAADNQIKIFGTDLEITAQINLNAQVENSGSMCINTKNMYDILRELPESNLELKIDNEKNMLSLSCEDISYDLLLNNFNDYPQVSLNNSGKEFKLNSKIVIDIINKTSHAVSTDETRINNRDAPV